MPGPELEVRVLVLLTCQSYLHAAMIDPTVLLIAGVEGPCMILRITYPRLQSNL